MPSELSLDVEARIEKCAVAGTSPKAYRVIEMIQTIECEKKEKAINRWASLKGKAGNIITTFGPRNCLCVSEEGIEKLLMLMKECEFKTVALSHRGHAVDETKVRQITLHAGELKKTIKVKYFYSV
jgi:hypothetical protein